MTLFTMIAMSLIAIMFVLAVMTLAMMATLIVPKPSRTPDTTRQHRYCHEKNDQFD